MDIVLDGRDLPDEAAFHAALRTATGVAWYGNGSLDALFDLLVGVVQEPVALRWTHAAAARRAIGPRFDRILTVILDAVAERPGAIDFTLEA